MNYLAFMNIKKSLDSELILNRDGSIYHLHLLPEDIGDIILLVGDPNRAKIISKHFHKIQVKKSNREFYSYTGIYKGMRITALSTGIGTDNIDIVVNELDALVNFDFKTKMPKDNLKSLTLIRIGTSGSLQPDIPIGSFVVSKKAIGFDGLLNFYENRNSVCDLDFENQFKKNINWSDSLPSPYVVDASSYLLDRISNDNIQGITISTPGFYGPQGRILRLPIWDPYINTKIQQFSYNSSKITNYEMECSAIYGLAKLMGHHALTICVILANRIEGTFLKNYRKKIDELIEFTLEQFV